MTTFRRPLDTGRPFPWEQGQARATAMPVKLSFATLLLAVFLVACTRETPRAEEEPAYLPEKVRQARAQAAEQSAKLQVLMEGSTWQVLDVSGREMVEGAKATMAFSAGGTVSGSTGCNSFNGAFTSQDARIAFGPLVTTRMMCPEPVMEQERFVLDTLNDVISAGVNEDGLLFLSTLNGDVIRLAQEDD